jgi:hypothetical protein
MKFEVLISKSSCPLALDEKGAIPNEWVCLDRLSQGLVSRYLWAKAHSSKKSNENISGFEVGDWLMLQPFAPLKPIVLAVWVSKSSMDLQKLKLEASLLKSVFYDPESIAGEDLKNLQKTFPSLQVWERGHQYPDHLGSNEF